ncbi:hypothetical protein [Histidinibacterium lentulum]|uniref:Sialate O-acetylesterase domain-containing protein n=1 Tax=Histidinibacterium lentulum TaxID=2480588 RepID=A0A3N2QVE7_9RHOB|nr:hypothetical protein [Histidinibacterium lentulum]ROT99005.1 hypothetical protein EAT49_15370 [Histidinibacterium lentulum]
MPVIGCGTGPAATLTGLLPALPPAAGFEAALAAVAGAAPGYPGGNLITEAQGTLASLAGWEVIQGAATLGPGQVAFARDAAPQRVRLALPAPVAAGTRVRVLWRQEGAGGLGAEMGGVTGAFRHGAGWQGTDLTLVEAAVALDLVAQAGADGLVLREVALLPLAAEGHDILLLMGDEGITGARSGAASDPVAERPGPRVDLFRDGVVGPALAPVFHRERGRGLGPVEAFAALYARRALRPGRRLLLVPAGRAGAALTAPEAPWRPGNGRAGAGDLFGAAVADALAALALPGEARLVAAWWAGGAVDLVAGAAPVDYALALADLVAGLRGALGADLPVVISGANPAAAPAEWLAAEAALDRDSGAPGAVPGVMVVPWTAGLGDGTAPGEAAAFSGGANRLRGAEAARALIDRELGAAALDVIGPGDLITEDLLIAA